MSGNTSQAKGNVDLIEATEDLFTAQVARVEHITIETMRLARYFETLGDFDTSTSLIDVATRMMRVRAAIAIPHTKNPRSQRSSPSRALARETEKTEAPKIRSEQNVPIQATKTDAVAALAEYRFQTF